MMMSMYYLRGPKGGVWPCNEFVHRR